MSNKHKQFDHLHEGMEDADAEYEKIRKRKVEPEYRRWTLLVKILGLILFMELSIFLVAEGVFKLNGKELLPTGQETTVEAAREQTETTAAQTTEAVTETESLPKIETSPYTVSNGGYISPEVAAMEVTDEKSAMAKIRAFAADNALSEKDYPDYMVELLVRNPETAKFVLNFPILSASKTKFDHREFIGLDHVPHLLQWDPRWGYKKYGSSIIGITGCGPTTLSMVAMYLLQDSTMTPDVIAEYSAEHGYSITGEGTDWSLITVGAVDLGMNSEEIPKNEDKIKSALKEGKPVIIVVGPGDFTDSGHFLVLTGLDKSGRIKLNDANSYIRTSRHWTWEELKPQIRGCWVLSAKTDE